MFKILKSVRMHLFIKLAVLLYLLKLVRSEGSRNDSSKSAQNIYLAAIVPKLSSAPALALRMAIEDINKLSHTYNPSRIRINIFQGESGCNSKLAAAGMYKMMSMGPAKPVIIAGCPEDCEVVAKAAPVWNAATMCFGMSQSELGGIPTPLRYKQPGLFSAEPNTFSVIPSLVKFIRYFGWKRVAILYEDSERYFDMADRLAHNLESNDIEADRVETSLGNDGLDLIEGLNARVVLTLASETSSREILCQIYHRRLFGTEKYVWFFLGPSNKEWFLRSNLEAETERVGGHTGAEFGIEEGSIRQVDCKTQELLVAADGHFTAGSLSWNPNEDIQTVSLMTVKDFKQRLQMLIQRNGKNIPEDYDEAPLAYDTIWAAFLVLNKTIWECHQEGGIGCEFTYENHELGYKIQEILRNFWFMGISGNFSYDLEGQRSITNAYVELEQFKNNRTRLVASHFIPTNNFTFFQDPFSGKIPDDGHEKIPDFVIPPDDTGTWTVSPPVASTPPKCNDSSDLCFNNYIIIYNLLFYLGYLIL